MSLHLSPSDTAVNRSQELIDNLAKIDRHLADPRTSETQIYQDLEDLRGYEEIASALGFQEVDKAAQRVFQENLQKIGRTIPRLRERITAKITLDKKPLKMQEGVSPPIENPARSYRGRTFFAQYNQFNCPLPLEIPVDAHFDRNSACTPSSAQFIRHFLSGNGVNLNQVLLDGQRTIYEVSTTIGPIGRDHLTLAEVLPHIPGLRQLEMQQYTITGAKETFNAMLNYLREIRNREQLPSIGAVLTKPPESCAIILAPNPRQIGRDMIIIFDPHGKQVLTVDSTNAYVIEFDRDTDAVDFLMQHFPFIDLGTGPLQLDQLRLDDPMALQAMMLNQMDINLLALNSASAESLPAHVEEHLPHVPSRTIELSRQRAPYEVNDKLMQACQSFRHIAEALASLNIQDYDIAFNEMAMQESMETQAPFRISKEASQSVVGRTFFHIYHIHRNESPEKLQLITDADYGRKAFYFIAEPLEKKRAAERVLIELALEGLEDALRSDGDNIGRVREYLDLLGAIKLETNDRPKANVERAEHRLYGLLYQIYRDYQRTHTTLVHPHNEVFKGDFGRHGFRNSFGAQVPKDLKIQAVQCLRTELKMAWKV